jgi:IclR family mhp operon transcriptional activator
MSAAGIKRRPWPVMRCPSPACYRVGAEESMPSFRPVVALARGIEILRLVNDQRVSTVGSLHKATGLDKATIVRMLETLEHEGYVLRDAESATYAPTGRSLLLSQGYDQHLWIGSVAEPIMRAFRKEIGWPSDIALFDRDAMIVAQTTREPGSMLISRRPGFRFPVLATSMGRAYLAFCDETEREKIIARLAEIPEHWNDLARHPRRLSKMIAETRERVLLSWTSVTAAMCSIAKRGRSVCRSAAPIRCSPASTSSCCRAPSVLRTACASS